MYPVRIAADRFIQYVLKDGRFEGGFFRLFVREEPWSNHLVVATTDDTNVVRQWCEEKETELEYNAKCFFGRLQGEYTHEGWVKPFTNPFQSATPKEAAVVDAWTLEEMRLDVEEYDRGKMACPMCGSTDRYHLSTTCDRD